MKAKKISIILILSVFGLTLSTVLIFCAVNVVDESMSSQVSAILSQDPSVSKAAESASMYLKGLTAAKGKEPKRCRNQFWCARDEILKNGIAEFVEQNSLYLNRFTRLVQNQDLASSAGKFPFSSGAFNFLKLAKLQRLDWNQRLAHADDLPKAVRSVVDEMQMLNQFLINSLQNPQMMIDAQIFLLVLKTNRNFLEAAAAADSKILAILKTSRYATITAGMQDLDFDSIASRVRDQELRYVSNLLRVPLTSNALGLALFGELSEQNDASVLTKFSDRAVNTGFLFNDTLNRHLSGLNEAISKAKIDSEPTKDRPLRRWIFSPKNIVGRNLVAIFLSSITANFVNMQRSIQTLQKPISFEDDAS